MTAQTNLCPICGSTTKTRRIDYMDWSHGNILVIRDVPVRECRDFGHQFLTAKVAKEIEHLFELDGQGTLQAQETISVPVVRLDAPIQEHV